MTRKFAIAGLRIAGTPLPFASWYRARTRREQVLLLAAAAALALFALHAAVYRPIALRRDADLARIAHYDAILRQLDSLPAEGAAQPPVDMSVPLATVVTDSAVQYGLVIRRLEPGDQSVSLTIDGAPADALFIWLDGLSRDDSVAASAVRLERQTAPGTVSASLTLDRILR